MLKKTGHPFVRSPTDLIKALPHRHPTGSELRVDPSRDNSSKLDGISNRSAFPWYGSPRRSTPTAPPSTERGDDFSPPYVPVCGDRRASVPSDTRWRHLFSSTKIRNRCDPDVRQHRFLVRSKTVEQKAGKNNGKITAGEQSVASRQIVITSTRFEKRFAHYAVEEVCHAYGRIGYRYRTAGALG
jgi:hypothetical protein